nr:phage/plasmid replication protein [uncultured Deefgea sp.]
MFIDKIRMTQTFPYSAVDPITQAQIDPIAKVDSGVVSKWGKNEDGTFKDEPEWISSSKVFERGSFSSMVVLKSDGQTMNIDGNVGRWNRPDNLFNLDLPATIAACNEFIAPYGLPPFDGGKYVTKSAYYDPINDAYFPEMELTAYEKKHNLGYFYTGAVLDEVHCTRNYVTGSPTQLEATISWLAMQSKNRVKTKPHTNGVGWGSKGTGRIYLKAYGKAREMLDNCKHHGRTKEEVLADPVYQFCLKNGVLRFEAEIGHKTLAENHCRYLAEATMEKLNALFEKEVDYILNRVRDDITALDINSLDLPNSVKGYALAYLSGIDVRAQLLGTGIEKHKTAFYRAARKLKEFGIDLNEPIKGAKTISTIIKVVEIKPLDDAPSWYWNHQSKLSAIAANESALQEAA